VVLLHGLDSSCLEWRRVIPILEDAGLEVCLKLTNTDPFAAWFVVTGDATPDGMQFWCRVLV